MDALALIAAFLLVLLNGFFVATEFAIVRIRPTRIDELMRKQKPGADAVRAVMAHIDAYLSAAQLGITIASLGLGWIGEPAFASLIEEPLARLGLTDSAWLHRIALALSFITITVLHIVVGEQAPKLLAIFRAESVALAVALPMRAAFFVLYPFIWALNGVSQQLVRVAALGPANQERTIAPSEEELRLILAQARSAGLMNEQRAELLGKALTLPVKTARHLMIPRHDVVVLDINHGVAENINRAVTSRHTHFPLCNRELDDVIGIVNIPSVLYEAQSQCVDRLDLRSFATPAVYFPEMMSAERLLAEFRSRRLALAIIVDEFGGASGIVSPTDVVSAVLGGAYAEHEHEFVALPGGAYDVEGTATLEDLEHALHIALGGDEMRTVAGFLMVRLGRMPRIGDRLFHRGLSFHVLDVTGPRVRRIRIQKENPQPRARDADDPS